MITITRDQLAAMDPCGLDARLKLFGRRKSMNVTQALAAGATIRDTLWVAARLGYKGQCATFALTCARRVERHTTDPRAKACNDATEAYLADRTDANRTKLRAARSDAAYAADAADAAYAAYAYAAYAYAAYAADAYAAYAADGAAAAAAADAAYAADAAAYAADAAYAYAAYAADAADAAARQTELDAQHAHLKELFS
jgi:hypothetical protein